MVTKRIAGRLMDMMGALQWIHSSCDHVIANTNQCHVKGTGFILDNLKSIHPLIRGLSLTFESLKTIEPELKRWIKNFEKNYGPFPKKNLPEDITKEDAEKFKKVCKSWMDAIYAEYSTDGTVLLTDKLLRNFIPNNIKKKLDKFEKGDLNDGISALQHMMPTPAVATILRVGERVIQKYYKKTLKKNPGKKTWGQMLNELEKSKKVPKSLLGYLYYLNDKRIDSAHPYRRYSQEEGERILLNLKDLLESVYGQKKVEKI